MDPETEQLSEEAPLVEEVVTTAPETIIVKRRGRPAGARNKTKAESSTGGTVETAEVPERERTPDPLYTALMKRLDTMMEATMKQSLPKVKKERAPRKVAMAPPPAPTREPEFRIQGSPRTASRQLMEHPPSHQLERASARERMNQNFLLI